MKYIGIIKQENGYLTLPDVFRRFDVKKQYKALEIGGDLLLLSTPINRERLTLVENLAKTSIEDHRKTLEGLAR